MKWSLLALLCISFVGCQPEEEGGGLIGGEVEKPHYPDENDKTCVEIPPSNPDAVKYEDIYDPVSDQGQYYIPETNRNPKRYWNCVNVCDPGTRNHLDQKEIGKGLQYHLLAQSMAGLVNRAMAEGKIDFGMWLDKKDPAYQEEKALLGREIGAQTAVELATKEYDDFEGVNVNVKDLFDGYVLTDVVNNDESLVAASVASHVFNSLIVDVRDEQFFKDHGYKMTYDARHKSTADAWKEFKDHCSNKALVIMPLEMGELREFAIRHNLFCINLNMENGNPSAGQNTELFHEVLQWLAPGAPVLGWEKGVNEDIFVERVSKTGHLMQAADWSYNHTMTSLNYRDRQEGMLAEVVNPRDIDYYKTGNFVSYFLSDGDNYQFVMGRGFDTNYYQLPSVGPTRMSFGLCLETLSQLAPNRFKAMCQNQDVNSTIMETFGGGYIYADNFSIEKNRKENLAWVAQKTAAHMRQHRIKVLHLMTKDWDSELAQEAYKAFIEANEDLEGIVVIQYAPYNAGNGNILWFKNKAGYDIPVISAKYTLWKGSGSPGQGDPTKITNEMRAERLSFSHSAVCIHAWSKFDEGRSSDAALACMNKLPKNYHAVNMQELIWMIRMRYRKEQTLEYLKTIK